MKKKLLATIALAVFGFTGCVEDKPFVGFTAITQSPSIVTSANAVLITATATGVEEAVLIYSIDGVEQTPIAMTPDPNPPVAPFIGVKFTAASSIPAQELGTVVTYRVEARGATATISPVDRTYTVGPDYTQLVLNEVNGVQKFIEIYNKGTEDLDLKGIKVERNEGESSYTQTKTVILPAGGYAIVRANNYAPVPAPPAETLILGDLGSGLSAGQAVKIVLYAPDGTTALDTFLRRNGNDAFGTGYENIGSYTRYPNGTGPWFGNAVSSAGAPNPATTTVIPELVP